MKVDGETSDGFHTFNELYEHRRILTASLFNLDMNKCLKSKKHHDGTMFDNYFIVGINTDHGWATYHYEMKYWSDFYCDTVELFPEWDGHDSKTAIWRIKEHFKRAKYKGSL